MTTEGAQRAAGDMVDAAWGIGGDPSVPVDDAQDEPATGRTPGPADASESVAPVDDDGPVEILLGPDELALLRRASAARGNAQRRRLEGAFAEAAEAAGLAGELFGSIGLSLARARVLRLRADALLAAARPDDALEAIAAARDGFAADRGATPADRAAADAVLGTALRMLGRFPEAREHLVAAADAFDAVELPARAAICRLDQAVVLHAEGRIDEAVTLLLQVRAVLLRSRRPDAVAICDFDLGVATHDLGALDDAVEHLQQARATFASIDRADDVAACNQNLGVALLAMGRFEEARQRLRDARAVFAGLGRLRDAAECDHDLAVVTRALGDEADADRLEAQALQLEAEATRQEAGAHPTSA